MADNALNQTEGYTNVRDLDLNFRYDLSEKIHAESLLSCIQCGVCSSGCQVSGDILGTLWRNGEA